MACLLLDTLCLYVTAFPQCHFVLPRLSIQLTRPSRRLIPFIRHPAQLVSASTT